VLKPSVAPEAANGTADDQLLRSVQIKMDERRKMIAKQLIPRTFKLIEAISQRLPFLFDQQNRRWHRTSFLRLLLTRIMAGRSNAAPFFSNPVHFTFVLFLLLFNPSSNIKQKWTEQADGPAI
jgi:hypothetical protein